MKGFLIVWLVCSNLGWTLHMLVMRWRDQRAGLGTLYLLVMALVTLYMLPGLVREAWL